jgi:hypothetical protein
MSSRHTTGLVYVKDEVDYLPGLGISDVVAVRDTKEKRKRRRHSSIMDNPKVFFGML